MIATLPLMVDHYSWFRTSGEAAYVKDVVLEEETTFQASDEEAQLLFELLPIL